MEKLTFKQLTSNILYKTFGLRQKTSMQILIDWLEDSKNQIITNNEEAYLTHFKNIILLRGSKWNEYELAEWFIGPIISLIDFSAEYVSTFAQRDISAQIGDFELLGRPDMIIASGIDSPQEPYFCIQEYKQQTDPNGNPQTQLLGAMLVSQKLNNNEKPVYGIYIVGYQWTFIILHGNEWCETKPFSVTDDNILNVFCMLKSLKNIILNY